MKQNHLSARITLLANRLVALVFAALLPMLPLLRDWSHQSQLLSEAVSLWIMIAFYLCAVPVAIALWSMDRLLRNILEEAVFTRRNVSLIRCVQWCCAGVSLICLPAAFIYLPLSFMVVIMAFLCLVVSVVAQVMAAAVSIREENDLTI
jgi:hypothetical protein